MCMLYFNTWQPCGHFRCTRSEICETYMPESRWWTPAQCPHAYTVENPTPTVPCPFCASEGNATKDKNNDGQDGSGDTAKQGSSDKGQGQETKKEGEKEPIAK